MAHRVRLVGTLGRAFVLIVVGLLAPTWAAAQVSCPDSGVRVNQVGRYAYHNANRNNNGVCTNAVGIPQNGLRVFSSWANCQNNQFVLVGEQNASGFFADSIICPDCIARTANRVTVADGQSVAVNAYFGMDGGTAKVRYQATLRMLAPNANGFKGCRIENAVLTGSGFGGDAIVPTAQLSALSANGDNTFTTNITLSESSTDFDVTDLNLTNATAVLTGSGSQYSAVITPTAQGQFSVQVKRFAFSDAASNPNTAASNQVVATFDSIAPTVTITGLPATFQGVQTLIANIGFSESVIGVAANDLIVTNGTVTNLTGSGSTYVATIQTNGSGDLSVQFKANGASDAAGNGNVVSATVTVSDSTIAFTQTVIADFMIKR
ncbi:MAG: Ig-like domain-containing protein, partial [Pseudomonadota bacterium]